MQILFDDKLFAVGFNTKEYMIVKNTIPEQIGFYAIRSEELEIIRKSSKLDYKECSIEVYNLEHHCKNNEVTVGIPVGKRKISNLIIIEY